MSYVCDVCGARILKIRYRCITCPREFDICQTCKDSTLPLDPPHEDSHSVVKIDTEETTLSVGDFYEDYKSIEATIGSRGYERVLDRAAEHFDRNDGISWVLTVNDINFYQNACICNKCHLDCNEELCSFADEHSKKEHMNRQIKSKYQGKITMSISGTHIA